MHARAALTLYGRISSLNTQRVLWALHEVRLPYELVSTSATLGESGRLDGSRTFGGTEGAAFLRCSPLRQIPALHDPNSGANLWESGSIVRYLAAAYKPQLLGAQMLWGPVALIGQPSSVHNVVQAAEASAWMDYHLATFSAGGQIYGCGDFMGNLMTQLVRLSAGGTTITAHGRSAAVKPCAETVSRAADQAVIQFGRLDEHLQQAGTMYFAGDAFTVADIPLGTETFRWSLLRSLLPLSLEAPATPALDAWLGRLQKRKAFVEGVQRPEEEHHAKV
jgi:glutathione S-transferase